MRRFAFPAAMVIFAASALCVAAPEVEAKDEGKQVLIQLGHYSDDLHAAFMAVKLGNALRKEGAQVTLFLNLEAARMADADTPLDMAWGHSGPLAKHWNAFVSGGGTVLVCPHCAKAAGMDKDNLRPKTRIAGEGEVAKAILAADVVLDY